MRSWVKLKCDGWRRDNAQRWRLFEGNKKSDITEEERALAKKRAELARVLDRLQAPGQTPRMAREARKHVAILEREIAELARGRQFPDGDDAKGHH